MGRRRVTIIGAGPGGACVAAQLMRQGAAAPSVVLIERGAQFGPGLAFGGADRAQLMNARVRELSAFADAPHDFAHWAARRGHGPDAFAPRPLYGGYLRALLARASNPFWPPAIKRVRGEAVACRPQEGGWRITLADARVIDADAVVLALGNGAPAPAPAFGRRGVPIIDARAALTKTLPPGDAVVIGAGLTMVDVVLKLAQRKRGVITVISSHGYMPRAHVKRARAPAAADLPLELPLKLSSALRKLRRAAEAAASRGEPWQWIADRARAEARVLWPRLSPDAQARFLRHARVWWDAHVYRAAPEIAAAFEQLRLSGRLRVMAGEIVSAARSERGFELSLRQRGSRARHRIEAAFAVNCSGGDLDVWRSEDPLLRQLLDEGVAHAHRNGVGIDVDEDGAVLNASGAACVGLYAIGALTQGALLCANAVPELRDAAALLAHRLAAPQEALAPPRSPPAAPPEPAPVVGRRARSYIAD